MPRLLVLLSILFVACWLTHAVDAGVCEGWQPGPLTDDGPNGTDGVVRAVVAWDPDGAGPQPEGLVIGGDFTNVEGVQAYDVAFRRSDTAQWQSLLTGIFGEVRSLCVHNGDLIAGGRFDIAGNQQCANIARWTGAAWVPLGSGITMPQFGDGGVYALASYNGNLYAAGAFVAAGGTSTNNLARWNGGVWAAMTGGQGGAANPIFALTVHANELIMGGNFTAINGVPANNVARWNGAVFSQFDGGVNGTVGALCSLNGDLYVGGTFNSANGTPVTYAARRSAGTWFALPQLFAPVCALAVHNNQVHCCTATGIVTQLYNLNGAAWNNITSFGSAVHGLATVNGELVAGGLYRYASNRLSNNIARMIGTRWHSYGGDTVDRINAFEVFGDRLLAAGSFYQQNDLGQAAEWALAWDGDQFVDAGISPPTQSSVLEIFDLFSFPVAGGGGTYELMAGRSTSAYVARAIKNPLIDPLPYAWGGMGPSAGQFALNGDVRVLERWNDQTYAGGDFEFVAGWSGIARWNVPTSRWVTVGNFDLNTVFSIKAYNGNLYVGGNFGLERWNGTAWSLTSNAFNGPVYALEVHNGQIIVGGLFPGPFNSPNLAKYNGSTVTAVDGFGNGGANGAVRVLKSINGLLYAGGDFTQIDNTPANRIAYWDGIAWHALGNGVNGTVRAIEWHDGELHVGGDFTAADGAFLSPGWAIWRLECACPADIAPPGGDDVTNVQDLLAVISAWGTCADPNNCPADIAPAGPPVGDDLVNVQDLLAVIGAWGSCP